MKRNGFTLIELLAVILILGIIALIAIPTVTNVINEAKKGSFKSSVENLVKAAETECQLEQMKGESITSTYTFTNGKVDKNLDIKGDLPKSGTIMVDSSCNVSIDVSNGTFNATKSSFLDQIIISDADYYKEEILNGADPVIGGNLIAVNIDSNGTVTKANRKESWYSYENKKWANAVVLFGKDTYDEGDTIAESAIKQYYVWIPRYKYQLWNVNSEALYPNGTTGESAINIVFESKGTPASNGDENGEWLTHLAFTSFDTNGLWVGKYETSYNEKTYTDNTKFLTSNPNYTAATTGTNIIIKPNVRSLTNKNVSAFYTMSREVYNNPVNSRVLCH